MEENKTSRRKSGISESSYSKLPDMMHSLSMLSSSFTFFPSANTLCSFRLFRLFNADNTAAGAAWNIIPIGIPQKKLYLGASGLVLEWYNHLRYYPALRNTPHNHDIVFTHLPLCPAETQFFSVLLLNRPCAGVRNTYRGTKLAEAFPGLQF